LTPVAAGVTITGGSNSSTGGSTGIYFPPVREVLSSHGNGVTAAADSAAAPVSAAAPGVFPVSYEIDAAASSVAVAATADDASLLRMYIPQSEVYQALDALREIADGSYIPPAAQEPPPVPSLAMPVFPAAAPAAHEVTGPGGEAEEDPVNSTTADLRFPGHHSAAAEGDTDSEYVPVRVISRLV
jgi:hypothetical protein